MTAPPIAPMRRRDKLIIGFNVVVGVFNVIWLLVKDENRWQTSAAIIALNFGTAAGYAWVDRRRRQHEAQVDAVMADFEARMLGWKAGPPS